MGLIFDYLNLNIMDPTSQVDELLFELKVERLKNQKLKREWQLKKKEYEAQI